MSRNTRWKLEKTKVKVVFRLQFHATHIPQTGWNNLFISFIPSDSGKASAKTNKANVRNGTCKWADPIYETTRLLQDSKTKQYEEKAYKLVVAMGTSRSSLLGEANINLSDFVDASKPIVVTLPLHGSDSGAILHVTVQLLTSKTGFREFEQQREVSDRGLSANTDHVGGKLSTLGEAAVPRADKLNHRVRFKPDSKELPSLEEESGFSEGYADSAAGFDGSSNASESLYAEKQENSSAREIDSVKSTASNDLGGVSNSQSPTMDKGQSDDRFLVHGTNEWIHQWGAENTVERDMTNVYEENSRLRGALEAADLSIHELKQDIVSLQHFADGLGAETHKLTEQIAVEISSEQKLANEVSMLKLECLRFKHDLEEVRNLKMNPPVPLRKLKDSNQANVIQDLRLGWLKGLKDMEDNICQLQNKVYNVGDLEALHSVLIDLRRATEHSLYQLGDIPTGKLDMTETENSMSDIGLGVELCHPEGVLLPGLLSSGTISVDANNEMQAEIFKLLRELDESKVERENLVQKMDQMECYYEALIQELEVNQKQILGELQNLRHEHASCIYTVSSTKAQMEAMHQQMNNELLQYAEERCSLDALNKELERRAVTSEAALKRARLNYSIAVNQLQKDLEVLSTQVVSMYETNENIIRTALSENSLPLLQGYEDAEIVGNVDKGSNVDKIMECPSHIEADRSLEFLKNPPVLQEDLCRKMQEELSEMLLKNLQLDVFSVTLHQAFLEADFDRIAEMHVLTEQLERSFRSNESLRLKAQNLSVEICTLNEENNISVSRIKDLDLEKQTLEVKLRSVSDAKCILTERIGELESLVTVYSDYKSKYEICDAEKATLTTQLGQDATDKHLLSKEVSLLQEELMIMKIKVDENENLQKMVKYMRENLENLLVTAEEQVNGVLPCSKEDRLADGEEVMSVITRLEDRLKNFHGKIFQLMEEKTILLNERDVARASFASAEVEVKVLKEEFEHDVLDMVSKLNTSSTLVEKLQTDLETITNRLCVSSEVEEKCTRLTKDLLSDFTKMENALKELTLENRNLADMVMASGSVADELDELRQENLRLTGTLQYKINEYDMLRNEHDDLIGTAENLQDEITLLRSIRDQLDTQIVYLNSQVKERDGKLCQLDQQEAEINLLKQQLLEAQCTDDKNNKFEMAQRDCLIGSSEKEIEDLIFAKEELEIKLLVLQTTIDEMSVELSAHGECKEEQEMLQKMCSDLGRKLSEQVLKVEEFKNLSVHLKEQLQAHEKKEAEGSSFASQESLRIAFIKEQYETKLQEIRHQLSISKKHGEEMLWKLQDALNELENKKKFDASQLKRNEELTLKITELEAELQLVLSDNREKFMAFEQLKAELDCSVMSLDCCMEEKNQLLVSLQECDDQKCVLADEVELLKEQLEIFKTSMIREKNSLRSTSFDDQAKNLAETNPQSAQETMATVARDEHISLYIDDDDAPNEDHIDKLNSQSLLSGMERLQKELERMRTENTLQPGNEISDELAAEVLQRDQVHLEKVSEELENMSSLYNGSSRSGNSMERVLALELELADVLQAKKKPSGQFQSSFLKLHRDEAAIFQSFRDINELIKDMLEMKERHVTMETELKDMHERYSQLSLDFAEVEGERQKLTMMLKNVRTSKGVLTQSPTSSHEELSS